MAHKIHGRQSPRLFCPLIFTSCLSVIDKIICLPIKKIMYYHILMHAQILLYLYFSYIDS